MKATCIVFVCPSCNSSFEVFLKKQPQLMTFDCPVCKTSLSLCDGQTIISGELQEKLLNIKTQSDLDSIIHELKAANSKNKQTVINDDDVLNLKIDLAACDTFDDVFKLLCK